MLNVVKQFVCIVIIRKTMLCHEYSHKSGSVTNYHNYSLKLLGLNPNLYCYQDPTRSVITSTDLTL